MTAGEGSLARADREPVIRAVAVVAIATAAYLTPVESVPAAPLTDSRPTDAATRQLGPIEDVVPVTPAVVEAVTAPAPTAVSGRELAWPRLHLGETGIVSTYGPGYRGLFALPYPWGPGWRVSICGPGGCVEAVSNDSGPERHLRRLADLDVATFEAVCGVSWRMGLCQATVTVSGRAE